MDELLDRFCGSVVLSNLQIRRHSGIILFCGGQIGGTPELTVSARDYFYRTIENLNPELFARIVLAEQIDAWAADMMRHEYTPDLLSFERHLSGLASFTCLIVESPGSIAELGAFSVTEGIFERLMVAVRREWNREGSYISRGPIDYLKKYGVADSVFVYPWGLIWDSVAEKSFPVVEDLEAITNDFLEDMQRFEASLVKRPKFNKSMEGNISLLIADFISQFSALKLREIEKVIEKIGLDLDRKKIKAHLLVLEKLNIIVSYEYRSSIYYVSTKTVDCIEYNFKESPDLSDKTRWSFKVSEFYQERDRSRMIAIKAARKELKGE